MPRRTPLKSQRNLVLIGLLLISCVLHTTFCEWQYKTTFLYPPSPGIFSSNFDNLILGYVPGRPLLGRGGGGQSGGNAFGGGQSAGGGGGGAGGGGFLGAGLVVQRSPAYISILCGVIAPLFLLGLDLYLFLGWRYQGRIDRGLCPECKYDLRGTDHESCPECGIPTSRARQ